MPPSNASQAFPSMRTRVPIEASGRMNADLVTERSRATFSTEPITNLLDGGDPARTARRRHLENIVRLDPTGVFCNDDNRYLHRRERHVRALAKAVRMIELCRMMGMEGDLGLTAPDYALMIQAVADDLPLALHWVMFVPNVVSLCDEEQRSYWLPLCRDFRVIGCYAQTELGHGSNVRALETTATFLKEADGGDGGGSWIIHSPTLTSSKFWPGTLGRTANHAVVIARLIDGEGVDRGIHNFIVPLRSLDDHTPLPGVVTGDIGPKIGFNNMDNGFARFDNVKIPRRNMAMRFATVDENGKYQKKTQSDAASKVAYITMMQVRAHIVNEAGKNLATGCTVAIRYSAVRRQGYDEDNGGAKTGAELQILDYAQQQHRLLPLLASAYCFFFTGKKIMARLKDVETKLVGGGSVTKEQVSDLHASSSCLKSFCTTVAADGIEECRKSCGGHGFLQASGLPELLGTYLQNPTVEGDNHMLPQQAVRVLLKLVKAVAATGDDDAVARYRDCDSGYLIEPLVDMIGGTQTRCPATGEVDMLDLDLILSAFQHRAARLLLEVSVLIQDGTAAGKSMQECWNDALIQMARASRAHSLFLLLQTFCSGINDEEKGEVLGLAEVAVMKDLALLFGLYWLEKDVGDFLEDGYFSAEQAKWVRSSVLILLKNVRQNAVALVDSWDVSDFRLKSALGRFDGDVYPAIMETSVKDSLNTSEPGPGYEHLRRLVVHGVGVCPSASRL